MQVTRLEEFAEMVSEARCWFAIEQVDGETATIVVQAEGPCDGRRFAFYRRVKYVSRRMPGLLERYERRYGVSFDGVDFWVAVYGLARAMQRELIEELRRRGVEAREGRYFVVSRPIP